MQALRVRCYIGVATGLIYTGLLGSGTSREYGVLGDGVNLASRLMSKQEKTKEAGILIDKTTRELIPDYAPIQFFSQEPFYVKGKNELIHAFVPKYTKQDIDPKLTQISTYQQIHHYEVGIETELSNIEALWTKSIEQQTGFVLLLESPVGTSKSFFLESLFMRIGEKEAETQLFCAKALQYVTRPYLVWNCIFTSILKESQFTENRSYRQHIKTLFDFDELQSYLSLANDIFGTQFLEAEKCLQLDEESRMDKRAACCLYVLKYFSKNNKIVIFLDNLHWMQGDDWKITEFVCNMVGYNEFLFCILKKKGPKENNKLHSFHTQNKMLS
ncbi:hypothetical protein RFI_23272 [Reticulomyxa filosa]|uniref:Guanylate cyclase domain-containing protein n=1 Tax=Reticulomyxa filosa TaxID=46433 RepID=X6MLX7_RETFI|nr:hypothetical protein RFI_23272 [Reticulomyxa filosa]|eukprot:ETO14090.1 hypothetical protein RFI_23272 [Reticulomyxa filosa]